MSFAIDFQTASSMHIEGALCKRLEQIRLSRNMTQAQLAQEAGISLRTVKRLEMGEGTSLDSFIRVMMALGIQKNLETFLPDPTVRPIERVQLGNERKRARSKKTDQLNAPWHWEDDNES